MFKRVNVFCATWFTLFESHSSLSFSQKIPKEFRTSVFFVKKKKLLLKILDGLAVAHHFNDIVRFKLFAELRVDQTMDVLRKFLRAFSQSCLIS